MDAAFTPKFSSKNVSLGHDRIPREESDGSDFDLRDPSANTWSDCSDNDKLSSSLSNTSDRSEGTWDGGYEDSGFDPENSWHLRDRDRLGILYFEYFERSAPYAAGGRKGEPSVLLCEDMVESYGVAYATRFSDDGYGEREPFFVVRRRRPKGLKDISGSEGMTQRWNKMQREKDQWHLVVVTESSSKDSEGTLLSLILEKVMWKVFSTEQLLVDAHQRPFSSSSLPSHARLILIIQRYSVMPETWRLLQNNLERLQCNSKESAIIYVGTEFDALPLDLASKIVAQSAFCFVCLHFLLASLWLDTASSTTL